jgi:1,6-anhydro-N-acetylmuramate kinase
VRACAKPVAVLNFGGVGNITFIGERDEDVIAFDTGPANGLVNEWVERLTGDRVSTNGALRGARDVVDRKRARHDARQSLVRSAARPRASTAPISRIEAARRAVG